MTTTSSAPTPTPPGNGTATTTRAANGTTTLPPTTTSAGTTRSPNATGNATNGPATTAAANDQAGDESIQWYHVTVGVLGLFVIVGGACYVTLMWQQNAIRNYKNNFEELVKKIGLKRNNLAEELKRERDDGTTLRRAAVVEDVRGVTQVDDGNGAPGLSGGGAAGMGGGAASGGGSGGGDGAATSDGQPLLATMPNIGVGKLHTYKLRTSGALQQEQEAASRAIELQMRRAQRDEELSVRRSTAAGTGDLLSQSVYEAVGVDRNITAVERRAQWRSLRSLGL